MSYIIARAKKYKDFLKFLYKQFQFLNEKQYTCTVNLELFGNSVKRQHFRLGHDLSTSVKDRVISLGFYFYETLKITNLSNLI